MAIYLERIPKSQVRSLKAYLLTFKWLSNYVQQFTHKKIYVPAAIKLTGHGIPHKQASLPTINYQQVIFYDRFSTLPQLQ